MEEEAEIRLYAKLKNYSNLFAADLNHIWLSVSQPSLENCIACYCLQCMFSILRISMNNNSLQWFTSNSPTFWISFSLSVKSQMKTSWSRWIFSFPRIILNAT